MKPSKPPKPLAGPSVDPRKQPAQPSAADLRQRAEQSLRADAQPAAAPQAVLENQKLLHELQVHQIELEMQNDELRKSQAETQAALARYTDLYDFAPAGYFTLQPDGAISQLNLAGARLLRGERALLTGKRFGAFVIAADLPVFNDLLRRVFGSEINPSCELSLVSEGQPPRSVRIEATRSDERDCRIVVVDITERKRMEDALRHSQEETRQRLREIEQIYAYSPIGLFTLDREYRFGRINESMAQMNGFPIAQHLGNTLDEILPELAGLLKDVYRPVFERGETLLNLDIHGKTPLDPHHERDWIGSYFPLRSATGEVIGLMGAVLEVTERKRAEQALRESEARLNEAQRFSKVGSWEFDLQTFDLNWSDEHYRIFEMEETPADQLYAAYRSKIHPDDIPECDRVVDIAIAKGLGFEYEHRVLCKDGSIKTVLGIGKTVTDANGKALAVHGTVQDITERKRSEELLRSSADRTKRIVRAAAVGLWEWNLLTNEVYLSPEWKGQLGYADDEMPNRFDEWQERVHPEDLPRALAGVSDFRAGHTSRYVAELRLLHRDGSWRWIYSEADLERNEKGEPVLMMGSQIDISERKQMEQALAASELFAHATIDAVSAHICVLDETGKILTCNQAWRDFFDKNHNEPGNLNYYIGASYLNTCEFASGMGADTGSLIAEGIRDLIAGRRDYFALEYPCHSPVEQRWFSAKVTRFRGGSGHIVVAHENITEVKLASQALTASEVQLRHLIENLAVGIVVHGPGTGILLHNQTALALLGLSGEQMLGKVALDPTWCFVREDGTPMPVAEYPVTRVLGTRDPVQNLVLGILRPLNDCAWVQVNAFPVFTSNDQLKEVVVTFMDITERKQAEAARASLEAQLRESQKMEAMGVLAGGVAHDFNNIVATILGNVALAQKDMAAGEVAGARVSLEEIAKAGKRAKAIVQQILTFSRKQQQELTIQPLRPLLEEALRLLRATLPSAVQISTAFADAPLAVRADAVQIGQVLVNLCTNAWHALEGNAGRISIELTEVWVDPNHDRLHGLACGRYARITVTDNGRGMDKATQARIFEPFFTTKGVGVGTGLGLSVVHGIVGSHQGVITVNSTPGQGSRFEVYLPMAQAPIEALSAAPVAPTPTPPPQVQGKHVLYLDDDVSLVFLVTRILKRQGYRVSGFERAEAALDAVRANPSDFDLVVTDFNMPGLSGLDVTKELQRIRPGLPVVITSGYVSAQLTTDARACGAREVLYKPNTVDELCERIEKCLLR